MTATISFELKPIMKYLARDDRWNVLTVLILHANIRNRCYPSMQTIADMATNGNLHKATDAKKWLEKHGAFELVAYGKRVDDEKNCGKRQHIYQLTGVLKACGNPECDCWHKGEYRFLYFNKQGVPDIAPIDNITTGHVVPTDNITVPDVAPVSNIKEADIVPTEIINGYKGSIPNKSNHKEPIQEKEHNTKRARKTKTEIDETEFKAEIEKHRAVILDLLAIDGIDTGFISMEHLAKPQQEKYLKIAQDLASVGIVFGEIQDMFRCVSEIATRENWSMKKPKASTLPKYTAQYLQSKVKPAQHNTPPTVSAPPSPNGDKSYSPNNPANAWKKQKAS